MESLILAQNERWQRGLGMQVVRESTGSILRERVRRGQWRKGEYRVGNLPSSWVQLGESWANTECGSPGHPGATKGGDLSRPVAK